MVWHNTAFKIWLLSFSWVPTSWSHSITGQPVLRTLHQQLSLRSHHQRFYTTTRFPSWRARSPHGMVVVGQTWEWKTDRKLRAQDPEGVRCQSKCGISPARGPIKPLQPRAVPRLSLHLRGPRVTARGANLSSPHAHLNQRHLKCPLAKQVSRPSQWTILSQEVWAASSLRTHHDWRQCSWHRKPSQLLIPQKAPKAKLLLSVMTHFF